MKWVVIVSSVIVLSVLAPPVLCRLSAQETSASTQLLPNLNGGYERGLQTVDSHTGNSSTHMERMQSINGTLVPLERTDERIVTDDATHRVIERTLRRYDQTGNPGPVETTTIEEQKRKDGNSYFATTYRADLNGNSVPIESTFSDNRIAGAGEESEVLVRRPTPNGMEVVEKINVTRTGSKAEFEETSVTLRKGTGGSFYQALKVVTSHNTRDGIDNDVVAEYSLSAAGGLELHSQTVSKTTKESSGGTVKVVDRYAKAVAGRVRANDSKLRLIERYTVERRPQPDGTVSEVVRIRRPTVSDPDSLGDPQLLSRTLCRGNCL